MLERLRDPEQRKRIAAGFVNEEPYLANVGWHHVRLGVDDPEVNGKLVEEIAEMLEMPPEEVFMDVVLEQEGRGMVIDWNNEEDTLRRSPSLMSRAAPTAALSISSGKTSLPSSTLATSERCRAG